MDDKIIDITQTESDFLITLKKPYTWEGKEYTEIDLSGLEDLSGEDVCRASKALSQKGVMTAVQDMDPTFCTLIATYATHMPYEFFMSMPAHIFKKVTRRVSYFLLDTDSEETED